MSVLVITGFGTRLAVTHDPKHSSAETRDHRKIRKVFDELNLESDLLRCIPLQRRCVTTVLLRNRSTESIDLTATCMPRISRSDQDMLRCNGCSECCNKSPLEWEPNVAQDPDTHVLGQATKPERLAEQIEQTVTNNSTEPAATK